MEHISVEVLKENFENLAQKIIVLAAEDYRTALKILKRSPGNFEAQADVRELELFFRGTFYGKLTELPGEVLIRKLRKEIGV